MSVDNNPHVDSQFKKLWSQFPPFTPREISIIAYFAHGKSTKGIARLFSVSPRTIENHVRNIMLKINCNSRESILVFVEKAGYMPLLRQYYRELNPLVYTENLQEPDIVHKTPEQKKKILLYILFIFLAISAGLGIQGSFYFWEERRKEHICSDFILPAKSTFIDRPQILKEIEQGFKNKKEGIQTIALIGIGGAGKTTLAHQYAKDQKKIMVWEIDSETPEKIYTSFENLAHKLASTVEDEKNLKTIEEIKNSERKEERIIAFVRERLKSCSKWLLIYDNVENFVNIRKYFPQDECIWGNGHIIITTRNSMIQHNSPINLIIHVDELDSNQKLKLFTQLMRHHDKILSVTNNEDETSSFLAEIPPFPLDIAITAYSMLSLNLSYKEYLEYLKSDTKVVSNLQEDILSKTGKYKLTRYKIITFPIQFLLKIDPNFQDLLLFICLLDSQNITKDLLKSYKNNLNVINNLIYNLKQSTLIMEKGPPSSSESTFSIHRSTQEMILAYLMEIFSPQEKEKLVGAITKALEKYLSKISDEENYLKIKFHINHVEKFLTHTNILKKENIILVSKELGRLYSSLHYSRKAKLLLEESLDYLDKYHKNSYNEIALTLIYLGNVYRHLGEYEKAKQLLEKSILICEKYLPNDHQKNALSLKYLGNVYRNTGDYQRAKNLFEQSLRIYKRFSPENQLGIASVLKYLGNVCRNLGEYRDARDFLEQAFSIYEKYPENILGKTWVSSRLGKVYSELREFEKARGFLEQALITYKENFPDSHVGVLWTERELGDVYRNLGEYSKAENLLKHNLMVQKKHYKEQSEKHAKTSLYLAKVYVDRGEYKQAKNLFKASLIIYKKYYGANHIETARLLENIAQIHFLENHLDDAEKILLEALRIFLSCKHLESYRVLENIS